MPKRFVVRLRQNSPTGIVVASSQVITINGLNDDKISDNDFTDRTLSGKVTTADRHACFLRSITTGQWGIGSSNYFIQSGKTILVNWNTTISGIYESVSWYAVNPYTFSMFNSNGLAIKGDYKNLTATGFGGSFEIPTVPVLAPQTFQIVLFSEELAYSKLLAKSEIYTLMPMELTVNGPSTAVSGQPIYVTISGNPDEIVEWYGVTNGSSTTDASGVVTVDLAASGNVAPGAHTWDFGGSKTNNSPKHSVTVIELCVPIYVPTVVKETEIVKIEIPTIIQTGLPGTPGTPGSTTSTTTQAPIDDSTTPSFEPGYTLTPNKTEYNEGETIEWTISANPLSSVTYPRFFRAVVQNPKSAEPGITSGDFVSTVAGTGSSTTSQTGSSTTSDKDYTEKTILLSGQGEQVLPFKWNTITRADLLTEGNENLTVNLYSWAASQNPNNTLRATASVTIVDTSKNKEPFYKISASPTTVNENATIQITIETDDDIPEAGRNFKVVASGTNVTASDFTGNKLEFGPVVFTASPGTMNVGIAQDNLMELDEVVTLKLYSWVGAVQDSTLRASTTFTITQPKTLPTVTVPSQVFVNQLIPFEISGGLPGDQVVVSKDDDVITGVVPSNPFNLNDSGSFPATSNGRLPGQSIGGYKFKFCFDGLEECVTKDVVVVPNSASLELKVTTQGTNETKTGFPLCASITGSVGDKITLYATIDPVSTAILQQVKTVTLTKNSETFCDIVTPNKPGIWRIEGRRGGDKAADDINITSATGTGETTTVTAPGNTGTGTPGSVNCPRLISYTKLANGNLDFTITGDPVPNVVEVRISPIAAGTSSYNNYDQTTVFKWPDFNTMRDNNTKGTVDLQRYIARNLNYAVRFIIYGPGTCRYESGSGGSSIGDYKIVSQDTAQLSGLGSVVASGLTSQMTSAGMIENRYDVFATFHSDGSVSYGWISAPGKYPRLQWTTIVAIGAGNSFEIKATVTNNNKAVLNGSFNSWISLSQDRTWTMNKGIPLKTYPSAAIKLEFRKSGSTTIAKTMNINFNA